MRLVGLLVVLAVVACSSSESSSGGASSSSSSGGSSSSSSGTTGGGTWVETTTCAPQLDARFFDTATVPQGGTFATAPCPAGYVAKRKVVVSGTGLTTFTDEASFVAAYCTADDAGAGDAGSAVDFASSDLIAAEHPGQGGISMFDVGGALWLRRSSSTCPTGPAPGEAGVVFFRTPKGAAVQLQSCSTTCTCSAPPCPMPP